MQNITKHIIVRLRKLAFSSGLIILFTIAAFEIIITVLLNNPSLISGGLAPVFQEIYMKLDRNIIQYLPECSSYNASLAYTLKPGTCTFNNREFNTNVIVNSAGFRDKESDLEAPEIIILGDSHAMGWGVAEDDMFANILEKKTGKRILNTAVSSYGTVRELKTLTRVRLDKLKTLIIQYCDNDIDENRHFYEHNNSIEIMKETNYDDKVKTHTETTKYYFGKYFLYAANKVIKSTFNYFSQKSTSNSNHGTDSGSPSEVELFINALNNSPVDLSTIQIIVFEMNGNAKNDSIFSDKLKAALSNENSWLNKIIVIDMSSFLSSDVYYKLDDHSKPEAHRLVAAKLAEILHN